MKTALLAAAWLTFATFLEPAHATREGDYDPKFNSGLSAQYPFSANLSGAIPPSAIGFAQSAINDTYLAAVSFQNSTGTNFSIVLYRLLHDGTPDTTFNSNGQKTMLNTSFPILSMATDASNDDIVLAGSNQSQSSNQIAVCRYAANGSIDNNLIGHNGVGCIFFSISIFGANANVLNVHSVAVQSWDHKIVIAGDVQIVNGMTSRVEMFVMRLFSTGSLDTGFNGTAGYHLVDLATNGASTSTVNALAFDATHRILAAGYTHNGSNADFAAFRLKTDGTLDSTCGTGTSPCTATADFAAFGGFGDSANSIYSGTSGHIYLAGTVEGGVAPPSTRLLATGVARLTSAFVLDTTFGTGGKTFDFIEGNDSSTESDAPPSIVQDEKGRPFLAGGDGAHALAWRFTTAGASDATYDNDTAVYPGRVALTVFPNIGTGEYPRGQVRLLFDADKPVAAAVTGVQGNPAAVELTVVRLLGDDTIFNDGFDD